MFKIKYYYFTVLFIFSSSFSTRSQNLHEGRQFELNDPNFPVSNSQSYTFEASEFIKLKPQNGSNADFEYHAPANNKTFIGRIDPFLIHTNNTFQGYNEVFNPSSRPWQVDKTVGKISAEYSVSETGSFQYQVPIEIPPGVNGVVPQLSLVYSSSGGGGILGEGWSLSGLSSISRANKQYYYDGENKPIQYDATDVFSIDGTRLIKDGTSYYTESENYDIYNVNSSSGSITDWEIDKRDGSKMYYGRHNHSKVLQGSDVISWLLDEFIDLNGNSIKYKYRTEDGQVLIDEIQYTANDGLSIAPTNKVKFVYEEKQHQITKYYRGYEVKDNFLLKKIITYSQGSPILEYSINYQKLTENYFDNNNTSQTTDFGRYAIKDLKLRSLIDGEEYHSTIFQYNKSQFTKGVSNYPINSLKKNEELSVFVLGDFNGDGITDVGDFNANLSGNITSYTQRLNNNGLNSFVSGYSVSSFSNAFYPIGIDVTWEAFNKAVRSTDLNGDNNDDLVICEKSSGSTLIKRLIGGSINQSYMQLPTTNVDNYSIALGDYTGDGVADGIGYYRNTNILVPQISFYLKDFNSQASGSQDVISLPMPQEITLYHSIGDKANITPFDYDGDGTVEILLWKFKNDAILYVIYDIVESQSSGLTYELIEINRGNDFIGISNYGLSNYSKLLVGDYNGDGNTDFLSLNDNNQQILITNDGDGNFNFQVLGFGSGFKDKWFFTDVNSDGFTDLIRLFDQGSQTGFKVMYSNGDGFVENRYPNLGQDFDNLSNFSFGDFDGDNSLDLFYVKYIAPDGNYNYSYTPHIHYFSSSPEKFKLHKIRNGLNQDIEVSYLYNSAFSGKYHNINNPEGIYLDGYISSTPLASGNVFLNKQMLLTSFVKQSVASAGSNYNYYGKTEKFFYSGIIFNKQGKGVIGLTDRAIRKPYENKSYTNMYDFNSQCNCMLPSESRVYEYPSWSSELYEKTTYSYTVNSLMSGKRYLVLKDQEDYDNYKTGESFTKTYTYFTTGSESGNLKKVTENNGIYQNSTEIKSYGTFGTLRPEHPLEVETISDNLSHVGQYSSTTKFDYFTNGSLKEQIKNFGTLKAVKTEYDYDGFGNLISQTVSSTGLPTLVKTSQFDQNGQFKIWSENAKGQRTRYKYFNPYGLVKEVIAPNGNIFKSEYNGFGRKTAEIAPDGVRTEFNVAWNIDNGPINNENLYYVEVSQPSSPTKRTYFDFMEREVMSEVDCWSDKIVTTTEYYYTPYNDPIPYTYLPLPLTSPFKVEKKSLPYYKNSSSQPEFVEYEYDELHRLVEVDHPHRGIMDYVYDKPGASTNNYYQITINDFNGQVKKERLNSAGEIVEVDDNGELIEYFYNDQGAQKEVLINNQSIATMEYDPIDGTQTKLTDANAGETTYEYDAYGNLIEQADNKGTTTLNYNNFNELITKTSPLGTITYNYVNQGGGLNEIDNIIHSNGTEVTYQYDNLGRPTTIERVIDNERYKYQYRYDSDGRLSTEEFPSGFTIKNEYNQYGFLEKIIDQQNSSTIWEGKDMNQYGQYTQVVKGDGYTTDYTYNTQGFLTDIDVLGLIDLSYDYNATTSNLDKWENNSTSVFEDFTYDNLDRLTKMSLNGTVDQSITYAANGNITNKGDLNNYSYATNKPNALIGLEDNGSLISIQEQNISYNALHQPQTIDEGINELNLTYGIEGQRVSSKLKQYGSLKRTRYYLPNYEVQKFEAPTNKEQQIHYIGGGDGLAAIYVIEDGVGTMYYAYTDYLGSILELTTTNGQIVGVAAQQSFDAWGRKRNPNNWTYSNIPSVPDWLYRGYTGHEHYEEFALINMNGRMYDPLVGRMLSVDNYVQDATSTQNYNRYSYALNNPLKYTDSDGEWAHLAIGALVGGFSGWQMGKASGAKGWKMVGYIFGGAAIGAASGGAAGAVSSAGGGAFISGAVGGAVGNGGFAALGGGNTGDIINGVGIGFISGGVGGTLGAAIGGGGGAFAGGAIGSGLNAKLNGASWGDVGVAAIGGGALSYGSYHASSYIGWKFQGGNKMGGLDIKYNQYLKMQAAYQRSRYDKKEHGFWLTKDGTTPEIVGNAYDIDLGAAPNGAIAEFHTHWDKPGLTIVQDAKGGGPWMYKNDFQMMHPGKTNIAVRQSQTYQHHSPLDIGHGHKSLVINRYDASFYPGTGGMSKIQPFSPPINRFVYSFFFW